MNFFNHIYILTYFYGCELHSWIYAMYVMYYKIEELILVAARSKAWVCGRLLCGIAVRIPQGAWLSVSCACCLSSGGIFCVGMITRPEESYRVWCDLTECGREAWVMRRLNWGCCAMEQENYIEDNSATCCAILRTLSPLVRRFCMLTSWSSQVMCVNDSYSHFSIESWVFFFI